MSEPTLSERVPAARELAAELDSLCRRAIVAAGVSVEIDIEVMISADGLDVTIFFKDRSVRKLNRQKIESDITTVVQGVLTNYLPEDTLPDPIGVGFVEDFPEEDLMMADVGDPDFTDTGL